jgi:hypothetical protein
MTPKEKAKELYFKMHSQEQIVSKEAKQCALIAVDEIIKEYSNVRPMFVYITPPRLRYWQEVKQEIEKL